MDIVLLKNGVKCAVFKIYDVQIYIVVCKEDHNSLTKIHIFRATSSSFIEKLV